jgi:hypothetical protein
MRFNLEAIRAMVLPFSRINSLGNKLIGFCIKTPNSAAHYAPTGIVAIHENGIYEHLKRLT